MTKPNSVDAASLHPIVSPSLDGCEACGASKGERCICNWINTIDEMTTRRDGAILKSARREIMRRMKFAKDARLDAIQNGNATLADFHWGVYSGLAMAAGIAFRELGKSSRRSG